MAMSRSILLLLPQLLISSAQSDEFVQSDMADDSEGFVHVHVNGIVPPAPAPRLHASLLAIPVAVTAVETVQADSYAVLATVAVGPAMDNATIVESRRMRAARFVLKLIGLECIVDGQPIGQDKILSIGRFLILFAIVAGFYRFGLKWDINLKHPSVSSTTAVSTAEAVLGQRSSKSRRRPTPWEEDFDLPKPADLSVAMAKEAREQSHAISASAACETLPTIWPKFTTLHKTTQLFVPSANIDEELWLSSVFRSTGVPVLTASVRQNGRMDRGGPEGRMLEITTAGIGGIVLASVCSENLELHGLGGIGLGRLELPSSGLGASFEEAVFVGTSGDALIALSRDPEDSHIVLSAASSGRAVGTVTSRAGAGELPYEHYELVAQPGVDVVLILACALAMLTFISNGPCSEVMPSLPLFTTTKGDHGLEDNFFNFAGEPQTFDLSPRGA